MAKLFAGRCESDDCSRRGESVDVWSDGVEAASRTLVNVVCAECRGALRHVLTPINIGGRSENRQDCTPQKHVEGCPAPAFAKALEEGHVHIVVIRSTPVQGVGGMVN